MAKFALAPPTPCTCVEDALARRALILARDRTGLVHFTVSLVLDDHPMGALLAGQVFDQYPEQLRLEHVATRVGLPPQALWHVARLEVPVTPALLRVYRDLLATLGQACLHARYHTLLDAQRLAILDQRFQERTAALHHEIAARTAAEAQVRQAHGHLRALMARLEALREAERTRLARDLHDDLGQQLTALRMDVVWIAQRLGTLGRSRTTPALLERVTRGRPAVVHRCPPPPLGWSLGSPPPTRLRIAQGALRSREDSGPSRGQPILPAVLVHRATFHQTL
jgi:Histidine kinase